MNILTDDHLIRGLDAICRAHRTNAFVDGHRGGALVSAYFFTREAMVEPGAAAAIRRIVDEQWLSTPLFAASVAEASRPDLLDHAITRLERSTDDLRVAGHDIILPILALKVFHVVPQAITATRIEGLCRLIDVFDSSPADTPGSPQDAPDPARPSDALAAMILLELLASIDRFAGHGQGWSGHLLTFGRAVIDLREMGHLGVARRAERAFRRYIARVRLGPLDGDQAQPDHLATDQRPHHAAYWQQRLGVSLGLGHALKYPYAFYDLVERAQDPELKARSMAKAYHFF